MAGAVLLSSIIDQILPRVSPPLIQIALGLGLAMILGSGFEAEIDPELFLVLFIAPLLFKDARNANKARLWKNKAGIISLAIGLVVVIVLVVGFVMNAIVPSIPLTCAFMLGAALGPTDAVAVESLSRSAKLDPREHAMLQGECLINDASGVVSFQFAAAAAVTGAFSLINATTTFVISFLGGIALGLIIAALAYYVRNKAIDAGLDSITFHVLLDVMLPFVTFIICEMCGVSGILGAVAAGFLTSGLTNKIIGPTSARFSIVTSSVWNVLAFVLNGLVFVLLGMQLPGAMENSILDTSINNGTLIILVLLLTGLITVLRFIWILFMNIHYMRKKRKSEREAGRAAPHADGGSNATISDPNQSSIIAAAVTSEESEEQDPESSGFSWSSLAGTLSGKGTKALLKSTLITTIGGPKGAITLSVIMSMPYALAGGEPFPQRELVLFLASGTIILTLLITNFLLPVLAPFPKEESGEYPETDDEIAVIKIEILRRVIADLELKHTSENDEATRAVIALYNTRIRRIRAEADVDTTDTVNLRNEVLNIQWERALDLHNQGKASTLETVNCMFRIARAQSLMRRGGYWRLIMQSLMHPVISLKVMFHNLSVALGKMAGKTSDPESSGLLKELERAAIAYLQGIIERSHEEDSGIKPSTVRAAREQLSAHRNLLRSLEKLRDPLSMMSSVGERRRERQRYAYHIELEEISQFVQDGRISRKAAKQLRDNVFLMLVELEGDI